MLMASAGMDFEMLRTEYERVRKEKLDLAKNVVLLTDMLSQHQTQIKVLTDQRAQDADELNSLRGHVGRLEAQLHGTVQMEQDFTKLKNDHADMAKRLASLQEENHKLRTRNEDLKAELDKERSTARRNQQDFARVQANLARTTEDLKREQERRRTAQRREDELQISYDKLKAQQRQQQQEAERRKPPAPSSGGSAGEPSRKRRGSPSPAPARQSSSGAATTSGGASKRTRASSKEPATADLQSKESDAARRVSAPSQAATANKDADQQQPKKTSATPAVKPTPEATNQEAIPTATTTGALAPTAPASSTPATSDLPSATKVLDSEASPTPPGSTAQVATSTLGLTGDPGAATMEVEHPAVATAPPPTTSMAFATATALGAGDAQPPQLPIARALPTLQEHAQEDLPRASGPPSLPGGGFPALSSKGAMAAEPAVPAQEAQEEAPPSTAMDVAMEALEDGGIPELPTQLAQVLTTTGPAAINTDVMMEAPGDEEPAGVPDEDFVPIEPLDTEEEPLPTPIPASPTTALPQGTSLANQGHIPSHVPRSAPPEDAPSEVPIEAMQAPAVALSARHAKQAAAPDGQAEAAPVGLDAAQAAALPVVTTTAADTTNQFTSGVSTLAASGGSDTQAPRPLIAPTLPVSDPSAVSEHPVQAQPTHTEATAATGTTVQEAKAQLEDAPAAAPTAVTAPAGSTGERTSKQPSNNTDERPDRSAGSGQVTPAHSRERGTSADGSARDSKGHRRIEWPDHLGSRSPTDPSPGFVRDDRRSDSDGTRHRSSHRSASAGGEDTAADGTCNLCGKVHVGHVCWVKNPELAPEHLRAVFWKLHYKRRQEYNQHTLHPRERSASRDRRSTGGGCDDRDRQASDTRYGRERREHRAGSRERSGSPGGGHSNQVPDHRSRSRDERTRQDSHVSALGTAEEAATVLPPFGVDAAYELESPRYAGRDRPGRYEGERYEEQYSRGTSVRSEPSPRPRDRERGRDDDRWDDGSRYNAHRESTRPKQPRYDGVRDHPPRYDSDRDMLPRHSGGGYDSRREHRVSAGGYHGAQAYGHDSRYHPSTSDRRSPPPPQYTRSGDGRGGAGDYRAARASSVDYRERTPEHGHAGPSHHAAGYSHQYPPDPAVTHVRTAYAPSYSGDPRAAAPSDAYRATTPTNKAVSPTSEGTPTPMRNWRTQLAHSSGALNAPLDPTEMIQLNALFSWAKQHAEDLDLCMVAVVKVLSAQQDEYAHGTGWQLPPHSALSASIGHHTASLVGDAFARVGKMRPVLEALKERQLVDVKMVEHGQTLVILQMAQLRQWEPFVTGHF